MKIVDAGQYDLNLRLAWRMETLAEVFDGLSEGQMKRLTQANREYYQTVQNHGQWAAVNEDGSVLGWGDICFQEEMPSPDNPSGHCAYFMNIYVRPRYRSMGIGRKIVSRLIEESRKAGADKIYLETSEAGHLLYDSLGFEAMKDYLKLNNMEEKR